MALQGPLYRICRRILRLRYARFRCTKEAEPEYPVVYICRHRNAMGPISSLCVLPLGVRPWVIDFFMETKACVKHLRDYTFPVTRKHRRFTSRVLAVLLGPPFARLVRSTGAIPVYRHSLRVRETFRETINALEAGDSIVIFPDVDYAKLEGETGSLYDGFLTLETLWNRKTGGHIRFAPINVSMENRELTIGKSVSFTGSMPFSKEKAQIVAQLEDTLNQMAKQYGA